MSRGGGKVRSRREKAGEERRSRGGRKVREKLRRKEEGRSMQRRRR